MTQSVAEIFTMQLARAAGKSAHRFLRSRGLQAADRDDVIGAAMLWCWENRESYSLTTTLETWFMNAVRDAYKDLKRNTLPTSDESLEGLGGGDETYDRAAAESSARALIGALTQTHKTVAVLTMRGYTRAEMIEKGISKRSIDEAHQRIKQLRRLLPDKEGERMIARTLAPVSSDEADDRLTGIDVEMERLEAPPPAGRECPPCIHCNWWEFQYQPAKSPQVEVTADAEVLEAQREILKRKIEISQQVRRDV
jgi:DNA-directed RNA polymerase specialized sigma24 family protein